jgi:DNA-binding transcriptional ArsR family regulator
MTALGDPTRRAIFERLGGGPMSVGALACGLPVSRPAVSQHLRVLKRVGLVRDRPVANRRVYSVDPGGVDALRGYFQRFWDTALRAYKEAAEQREEEP